MDILENRVKLIRDMEVAQETYNGSFILKNNMTDIIYMIRQDTDAMLAYSTFSPVSVSYSTRPEYKYDNKRRLRTSLQRYLNRKYSAYILKVPDHCIDKYVQCVFINRQTYNMEFLSGEDVQEAYNNGWGGESCMTGDRSLTQLYGNNPEVVRMMILKWSKENWSTFEDKVLARALVWKVGVGENDYYMDRIYPNDGMHVLWMEKYARDKGWDYRSSHGGSFNGTIKNKTYYIKLEHDGVFPYADTFIYATNSSYTSTDIIITNSEPSEPYRCLQYTSGDIGGIETAINYIVCDDCGEDCDEDDIVYRNGYGYCRDCDSNNVYCHDCEVKMYESTDYSNTIIGGLIYCQDCYDLIARECYKCHTVYPFEQMIKIVGIAIDDVLVCWECSRAKEYVQRRAQHNGGVRMNMVTII